jgi:DNA-binding MarR family transcriptional regulator
MNADQFVAVAEQVRLLHHQLVRVAEQLHAGEDVTVAQRAVLEYLHREGATTVPEIARVRGVTRQHIQVGVDELAAAGLVELVDNPAHRRSRLVTTTTAGVETIERMQRREIDAVADLDLDLDVERSRALTADLAHIRHSLQQLTQGANR